MLIILQAVPVSSLELEFISSLLELIGEIFLPHMATRRLAPFLRSELPSPPFRSEDEVTPLVPPFEIVLLVVMSPLFFFVALLLLLRDDEDEVEKKLSLDVFFCLRGLMGRTHLLGRPLNIPA